MTPSRSRVGKVETSPRLQATARVLRSAGSHGVTTREISQSTGSMAVHSDVHALRQNGYEIELVADGKTPDGYKINRYFLRHEPPTLAALFGGSPSPAIPSPLSTELRAPEGPDTTPGQVEGGDLSVTGEELEELEALRLEDEEAERSEDEARREVQEEDEQLQFEGFA